MTKSHFWHFQEENKKSAYLSVWLESNKKIVKEAPDMKEEIRPFIKYQEQIE